MNRAASNWLSMTHFFSRGKQVQHIIEGVNIVLCCKLVYQSGSIKVACRYVTHFEFLNYSFVCNNRGMQAKRNMYLLLVQYLEVRSQIMFEIKNSSSMIFRFYAILKMLFPK